MEVIVNVKIVSVVCCDCGIVFGMSDTRKERLLETGEEFYCTNGHAQYFTEKEKLTKKVEKLQEENHLLECRVDICTKTLVQDVVSYRFWNILRFEGLDNIGQILKLQEIGFRKIHGIGNVAVNQVNDYLREHGLKLA